MFSLLNKFDKCYCLIYDDFVNLIVLGLNKGKLITI